jgi:hypothetical protein
MLVSARATGTLFISTFEFTSSGENSMKRVDSLKKLRSRRARPLVERLEDRLVPGETLSALLVGVGWFAGSLLLSAVDSDGDGQPAALVAQDTSADPAGEATASVSLPAVSAPSAADWYTPSGSVVADSGSNHAFTDTVDGVAINTQTTPADRLFAESAPADDLPAALPDQGSTTGSYMLQSLPTTPPVGPGDAGGAVAGAAPAFTPAMTAGPASVGGGAASLAAFAGSAGGAATGGATATATPVAAAAPAGDAGGMAAPAGDAGGMAAPASDAGGSAAPLLLARPVAAPKPTATSSVQTVVNSTTSTTQTGTGTGVTTTNGARPNAAGGAAPFSPAQIQQAYGVTPLLNAGTNGAAQTIYIVDAFNDPNITKDLHTFDVQWGLPDPNFTVHKMSSRVRNSVSWGIEESLDVEWAHSIAPQASIVLVEATTNSLNNLYAAVDWATNQGAHIVSMSWGAGDSSSDRSLDSHFNHSGVVYLASSGDTGAQVIYPSASPYVVSVGGTSLTLDTNNNYVSESAWSSGGGGVSGFEAQPGYQTSYGLSLGGRGTPDVSFDADPNTGVYVYDTYYFGGGGWFQVGGTSLSAPSWAGLVALADQGRVTPLASSNLTSRFDYNAATGSATYASNYHDITAGSNGHAAGVGYDLATGVGSPQANTLIPWLASH